MRSCVSQVFRAHHAYDIVMADEFTAEQEVIIEVILEQRIRAAIRGWESERRRVEAAEQVLPFLIACVERHRARSLPMHATNRIFRHRMFCREQSSRCVASHDFVQ